MQPDEFDRIIENEQEWRRYMLTKINHIDSKQQEIMLMTNSLKVKIGVTATIFGIIGGFSTGSIKLLRELFL